MEATGIYHEALADALYAKGWKVCVLNPRVVHAFGKEELRRVKSDKADAKLIAEYGQQKAYRLRPWTPEPPARRRLRALARRLQDLQEILQMESNRLGVSDPDVHPSIRSVIAHVQTQMCETQNAIRQHIDDDPDLRQQHGLITSITGLGDASATTLLAELGDPSCPA